MNTKEIVYYYALQLYMNGVRMDDGDENETQTQPKHGHGGGTANTRLPYGLCQAAGIDVPVGTTPRQAWDLLYGKTGITAKEVYQKIKEEKSVGSFKDRIKNGVKKFKGKVEKFANDHMYGGLTKTPAGKKYAKHLINVYNDVESADPYAREVMGRIGELFNASSEDFPISIGRSSTEAYLASYVKDNYGKRIVGLKMPGIIDESTAKLQVSQFTHEMAHAIDHALQDIGETSWENQWILSAINNAKSKVDNGKGIGKQVKDAFDHFNSEHEKVSKKQQEAYENEKKKINLKYYGSEKGWSGTDYFKYPSSVHKAAEKEKKAWISKNKIKDDIERRQASGDNGVYVLQGLYDSISGGQLRNNHTVKYGHATKYFVGDKTNSPSEIFAEYMALAMCYPNEYKMFKDDQPELCAALENYTKGIVDKWLSQKAS